MSKPRITKVEIETFTYELSDVARDEHGPTYSPGKSITNTAHAITIFADVGVTGEYVWSGPIEYAGASVVAELLVGQDPLEREYIYSQIKQAMRQQADIGMSVVDIALWDLAGKFHEAPIHQLLGGYRKTLPTYPASVHATEHDELKSPEEMADFAEQCKELGYPAFKIHGWENGEPNREAETILALRDRVGHGMDLMSDPYNALRTFGDAIKVGRACDEAGYFWYEDPLADGGISQFAHRKLRELLNTPLLQTEHIRGLEARVDFMVNGATDFVRGDVQYMGITATMKLAHAAEGLGLDIEMHSPGPAQRQCMAAIRNTNYYELSGSRPKGPNANYIPVYADDYVDQLDAAVDGHFPVPKGPGLGVEYDWQKIRRNSVGTRVFE
ncbi:MAG: mandelate racemase [Chloroflexi bacterium]|nr:mandelate racemase [Chloroflexota bacterium]